MNSPLRQQHPRMKVDGVLLFGLLALLGAGVLFLLFWWRYYASDVEPVRVPLPLAAGHRVSKEFIVDQKAAYRIEVRFRQDLLPEELDRIERLGFHWSVSSRGESVGLDRSAPHWRFGNGFSLGEFDAVPGRRYVIQAQVQEAKRELESLNPHLVVRVRPEDVESLAIQAQLLLVLLLFLLIIAVLSLFVRCCRTVRVRQADAAARPLQPR
jgi:hypothetical protein